MYCCIRDRFQALAVTFWRPDASTVVELEPNGGSAHYVSSGLKVDHEDMVKRVGLSASNQTTVFRNSIVKSHDCGERDRVVCAVMCQVAECCDSDVKRH